MLVAAKLLPAPGAFDHDPAPSTAYLIGLTHLDAPEAVIHAGNGYLFAFSDARSPSPASLTFAGVEQQKERPCDNGPPITVDAGAELRSVQDWLAYEALQSIRHGVVDDASVSRFYAPLDGLRRHSYTDGGKSLKK